MKNNITNMLVAIFAVIVFGWAHAGETTLSCEGNVNDTNNIDMTRRPGISMDLHLDGSRTGTLITDSEFPGQMLQVDLQLSKSYISVRQEHVTVHDGYTIRLGDLSISRQSGRFTMVVTLAKENEAEPEASVTWQGTCVQAAFGNVRKPG